MNSNFIDTNLLPTSVKPKIKKMIAGLSLLDNAAVAFSGGVDSSILCVIAYQVMREKMVAMTIDSPINNKDDVPLTKSMAAQYGFRHFICSFNDLEHEKFNQNSPQRCYYCKLRRFEHLAIKAREAGFTTLLEGSNADDLSDYRPGLKAVKELDMRSPLADVGFNKDEIRTLAKIAGLINWNRPSQPCLATRIPYGEIISLKKIERIEKAERYFTEQGFEPVRVRLYQDMARVEIVPEQFSGLLSRRKTIVEYMKDLGITYITLDLSGFRSGSMNEGLTK